MGVARKLVTALAAAAAIATGFASSASAYSAEQVPFTAEDISVTGARFLAHHDDDFMPLALPFAFSFYGTLHDTVYASTNGLLTFGAGTSVFFDQALTGPVNPDLPMAAVLWDDWRTNRTPFDAMYHQTLGEPGARRFVVQWHLLQHFPASPSTVTFQAVLHEGSNDLEFRYLDSDSGDLNAFGASATVGVRDTSGRHTQWSHHQAVVSAPSAIRFGANRPPDCSGAEPSTSVLWPPNHKLRTVTVGGVTDPDGDDVTVRVTGVTHDEDDEAGDAVIAGDTVRLRAERDGHGDGRTYTVGIRATDSRGADCVGSVIVAVPHDRR